MTSIRTTARAAAGPADALFPAAVFCSAALVFMVEPMVGRLVLPLLGGSPAVWNTSSAFFQAALLAGYAYAHLLLRLKGLARQAIVHGLVLAGAAAALPLRIRSLGAPSAEQPAAWLVLTLALSIGAPFAALSATAPLVQAWRARTAGEGAGSPYALYAASNLGSLAALLAYPALVEPAFTLGAQTRAWSLAFVAFALMLTALAWAAIRAPGAEAKAAAPAGLAPPAASWRERLMWLALAALPSSLMLGVTSYITTDVASAPFLWVLPLALYLLSFVAAFQDRPLISPVAALPVQAGLVAVCAALLPFNATPLPLQLAVHLAAFFATALVCHQALAARRPPAERLTDFYLWVSLGGVVGGGFNAFVAPAVFANIWEYPLALTLSALVRPGGEGRIAARAWVMVGLALVAAPAAAVTATFARHAHGSSVTGDLLQQVVIALLGAAAIAAFLLRKQALLFCAALAALSLGANAAAERATTIRTSRSFFGVLIESRAWAHGLGGEVRLLSDGTTLHGAEAVDPRYRCRPLVYYTPRTPIGQVTTALQAARPALRIGVVGLGAGAMAAYVRPADRLSFFEIDPLVVRIASDPRRFRYVSECAKAPVRMVVGDARLTLAREAPASFDLLVIDAFSSDAVPAHLLTVEALRGYLARLTPDGVLVLHLSNRNLDLMGPARAGVLAAGGAALVQRHRVVRGAGLGWESDEDAVIAARRPQALAGFAADPRWRPADPGRVRPWTDDYVNVPGALWRKLAQRYGAP